MNFSINQVRNLYVANSVGTANTTPTTKGQIAPFGVTGKTLYFQHMGAGGLVSSDKIDVACIKKATQTAYAKLCDSLRSKTVKITEVVVGQTYTLKVIFRHYIGMGEEDQTVRLGTYTVKAGDTVDTIAAGLAASLILNTKKEKLIAVTVATDTITIKEVEQDWKLGKFPVSIIPFDVYCGEIVNNGLSDYSWATVADGASTATNNGVKKLADLEYFCLGTRGDEYRGMGYPRNIDSEYLIDMSKTYDVINIHYEYVGEGVDVQQSEKDIHILVPAGNTSLATAINTITGATEGKPAYIG
jgi:hypothetical protein